MKEDTIEFFNELHKSGIFIKSLNFFFLELLIKMEVVGNIKHLRPISLVVSIYKLIANLEDESTFQANLEDKMAT